MTGLNSSGQTHINSLLNVMSNSIYFMRDTIKSSLEYTDNFTVNLNGSFMHDLETAYKDTIVKIIRIEYTLKWLGNRSNTNRDLWLNNDPTTGDTILLNSSIMLSEIYNEDVPVGTLIF